MMTIKDVREWLKEVPVEFDDCVMVTREIQEIEDDDENLMAGDDPIVGCSIDIGTREACFYNQKSQTILNKGKDGNVN